MSLAESITVKLGPGSSEPLFHRHQTRDDEDEARHDEHEEPSARTTEARRQRQKATGKEESDDELNSCQDFLGRNLIQGLSHL